MAKPTSVPSFQSKMLKAALALLDCAVFAVVIVVKRIQFFFFPEHKEEVMQQQSDLIMSDERAKFFGWDKRALDQFMFTWKLLLVMLKS